MTAHMLSICRATQLQLLGATHSLHKTYDRLALERHSKHLVAMRPLCPLQFFWD